MTLDSSLRGPSENGVSEISERRYLKNKELSSSSVVGLPHFVTASFVYETRSESAEIHIRRD
jgi:hypothetical protein